MMLCSSASWKKSASPRHFVCDSAKRSSQHQDMPRWIPQYQSNSISIFKMGFVASIKNNGNSNELTNIRLYKTWGDTDILEPRQHLAWQRYTEENNPDDIGDESLPTISVFS